MVGVYGGIENNLPLSRAILKAKEQGVLPLVADIKPISPRDGNLLGERKPSQIAQTLANAGACALSVVTEPEHFGGSIQMLQEVSRAVSLPVLRKDFFSSTEQIEQSKEAGAAAVLLVLATIPVALAPTLYECVRACGMEAVVEIHTQKELERALELSPTIIGINNRDIVNLERDEGDVRVTEELAPLVPDTIVSISESSLRTPDEIRRAIKAGVDAVLIGTALLQSKDLAAHLTDLIAHIEN